ncbi:hypothetical protein ACROYT_G043572 [Oculina patagonica]
MKVIQTTTAPPMRSSEVQPNTTWDSLQTAGAECCVPLGLASVNASCGHLRAGLKAWYTLKGLTAPLGMRSLPSGNFYLFFTVCPFDVFHQIFYVKKYE